MRLRLAVTEGWLTPIPGAEGWLTPIPGAELGLGQPSMRWPAEGWLRPIHCAEGWLRPIHCAEGWLTPIPGAELGLGQPSMRWWVGGSTGAPGRSRQPSTRGAASRPDVRAPAAS